MAKAKKQSTRQRSRMRRVRRQHLPDLPLTFVPVKPVLRTVLNFTTFNADTEPAAAAGITHIYRLNGAYDVDTSILSTSTPGFSEWSAFYNRYRVIGVRVRVEGHIREGDLIGTYRVAMFPVAHPAVGIPTSPLYWGSQYLGVARVVSRVDAGGNNKVVLDRYYDMPRVLGITRREFLTDMDYSATVGGVPSKEVQLYVGSASVSSTVPSKFIYTISVCMEIEFFNPKNMSG